MGDGQQDEFQASEVEGGRQKIDWKLVPEAGGLPPVISPTPISLATGRRRQARVRGPIKPSSCSGSKRPTLPARPSPKFAGGPFPRVRAIGRPSTAKGWQEPRTSRPENFSHCRTCRSQPATTRQRTRPSAWCVAVLHKPSCHADCRGDSAARRTGALPPSGTKFSSSASRPPNPWRRRGDAIRGWTTAGQGAKLCARGFCRSTLPADSA